jgi:FixJ family two-component response regulator
LQQAAKIWCALKNPVCFNRYDYAENCRTQIMQFKAVVSIIDDDEGVRKSIQSLLQSLGYSVVHSFASVEEFLASRELHQTSCVISDVQMPGLSGIELQAILRTDGYRIRVILVTGYPDERIRDCAMQAGAASFLSKPINEANLIRCLDCALKDG